MCGIAGWTRLEGHSEPPPDLFRMLEAIKHRGPDGAGVHQQPLVGLGHVRLSIIDLAGGRQPMANKDGSLWLTFNGEIFNYLELREQLAAHGHQFRTRSDTEVILHAYEEFGEDCVQHFNGQWAFALWDNRKRTLFLSRDRVGVRPLYYWQDANYFLFASEIKSLLTYPSVRRQADPRGLAQLLTFWAPLAPRTLFERIHELPPGHSLSVHAGTQRLHAHWKWAYDPTPMHPEEAGAHLLQLLTEATRFRLRSDVPVGTYLSGGLDSSLTTALVKRECAQEVRSFSVTFDDRAYDESSFQREAADHIGTRHDSFACTAADIGRAFPSVVWHAEKPMLRTAPAPLYLLAQRVRERGFKVVITGEGADEVLGGYDIFKEDKIRRFWARQPHSRVRPLLLRRLYPYLSQVQAQPQSYLEAFFHIKNARDGDPFFSHKPRWGLNGQLLGLLSADWRDALAGYDPREDLRAELPSEFGRWPAFCRAQYLEARYLLPGYILSSQGDRMAMAHGVEGRFPFLDPLVLEFAGRLPLALKMRGLQEKTLLKKISAGLIPDSIRNRPKQPYRAPETSAFFGSTQAPLRWDYVEDLLCTRRVAEDGIFDATAVGRLVAKARQGVARSTRDQMAFIGVLSTQLWFDQFLRQPMGQAGAAFGAKNAVPTHPMAGQLQGAGFTW